MRLVWLTLHTRLQGLVTVLQERWRLLKDEDGVESPDPLIVLCPKPFAHWLRQLHKLSLLELDEAYTYVSEVSARDEAYTYVSGVSARVSLCVVSVLNTSVHFYVGSVVSRNVHLLERDVSSQFCS